MTDEPNRDDDYEERVQQPAEDACDVWHILNVYCTPQQREQFNEWRSTAYQKADAVRDWIRHRSMNNELAIPEEMNDLIALLCKVPILCK